MLGILGELFLPILGDVSYPSLAKSLPHCGVAQSLIHTSRRLQQLSQRARLLQIIGNVSIFTAMDCDSRWLQQICSLSEQTFN